MNFILACRYILLTEDGRLYITACHTPAKGDSNSLDPLLLLPDSPNTEPEEVGERGPLGRDCKFPSWLSADGLH